MSRMVLNNVRMKINQTLILLAIVVAGCSQGEQAQVNEKKEQAFNVRLEKALPVEGTLNLKYSGVVEASQTTPLSFAIAGTVAEVMVTEGQKVRKGQLLARLDLTGAKSRRELAIQQQKRAQDAYDRMKPMKENGTLPEIQWVEVETGLGQATTAVAITQQGINDCYLYANKEGIIGSKSIVPGMNILPTATVIELIDIQKVYVKIPVSEDEIVSFKKGQPANIHVGALAKNTSGTVKEIGVSADFLSHTYPVKIEVDNEDLSIKPGMVCEVTTTLSNSQNGVLVSQKALQVDIHGKQFVYVQQNGSVEKREVKTNTLVKDHVLVTGNLKAGEEVVVAGQQKLVPGMSVNAIL